MLLKPPQMSGEMTNPNVNTSKSQGNSPNLNEPSKGQGKTLTKPKASKKTKLSLKDRLYLKNLEECKYNSTKAYIKTYPDSSYNSARAGSTRKNKTVIANVSNDVLKRVTPEYIIENIEEIAKSGKNEANKLRAWELLGKFKALFTEKLQTDGKLTLTEQHREYIRGILLNQEEN